MTDPFQNAPSGPVYSNTDAAPNYVPFASQHSTSIVLGSPQLPPRRSRVRMAGAVVGVGAILVAGTFALAQLQDNRSGGAASPEDLAGRLVDALDNEDALGAIDLLLPGERDTFRQPLIDLVDELSRLEVVADTATLEQIGGLDVQIDVSGVSVASTNVSDIANVTVHGSATVTVDGDKVPIGDLIIDRGFDGDRPDLDAEESNDDLELTFTAVERDQRWYVSALYTAMESTRKSLGSGDEPADIPAEGIEPVGADTPEGALDNLIDATADLDVQAMIASLNPNEAEAFQRYAPLLADDADEAMNGSDWTVKVSDLDYTVTGEGDVRQVGISSASVEISDGSQTASFEFDERCATITVDDEELFSGCANESGDPGQVVDDYLTEFGIDDTEPFVQLVTDIDEAFSDFSMNGVVVKRVDGAWYVSPIATYFEVFLAVGRALDRDEIETLIDDGTAAVESFIDQVLTFDEDDYYTDDDYTDDDYTDDEYEGGWYECLGEDVDAAAQCIVDGVETGDYDPMEIPAPLLYPECGLFEYYYGTDIYDATPQEFLDEIEPYRDCIVQAADAAGIDLTYLTPELAAPECFADVNPYDYLDDKWADAAECAAG